MTGLRPDDLDRLAADPSDRRLVKLALAAAAREIAFLRGLAPLPPPEAAHGWVPAGVVGGRSVIKRHHDRLIWAGTTALQAFSIETACLSRLALTPGAAQFPVVLAVDAATPSLTLVHAGRDLRNIARDGRPVAVPQAGAQVGRMIAAMRAAGILHLDLHPDGRNLCVSEAGHLTLVDFDIAAVDGLCLSGAIAERYAALTATGDPHAAMEAQIEAALARCPLLRRD